VAERSQVRSQIIFGGKKVKAQLIFGFLVVSTSALGSTSTMGNKTSINGVIHGAIASNLIQ
jgi:hypothetical protein